MTSLMIRPQKALSIQQPWASLIITGNKLVENRTWATKWRGTLAIHAGKTVSTRGTAEATALGFEAPYPTGYLGTVELVDVHAEAGAGCCGIWAQNSEQVGKPVYHWRLAAPLTLPEPVEARGMLGLFTPAENIDWGSML